MRAGQVTGGKDLQSGKSCQGSHMLYQNLLWQIYIQYSDGVLYLHRVTSVSCSGHHSSMG